MDNQIVRCDKEFRKKFFIIYILIGLAGLILIKYGLPSGVEYLKRQTPRRAFLIMETILILFMSGVVCFGIYFFRLGRRVIKYECFPPPGLKLIKDTPLIEGKKARSRGQILLFLSILIILIGVGGSFYIHYIFENLFNFLLMNNKIMITVMSSGNSLNRNFYNFIVTKVLL